MRWRMPVDLPPTSEVIAVTAAGAAGAIGRLIGWLRQDDRQRPLGRWTWCFQLPVGAALGWMGATAALAAGVDQFWQVILIANAAGILGPDAADLLLRRAQRTLGLPADDEANR